MKQDPLEKAAKAEALRKAEAECTHPHVHFRNMGREIRCVDCPRFWTVSWTNPQNKMDTTITDFHYVNPKILDTEFRHSPNEAPRQAKLIR